MDLDVLNANRTAPSKGTVHHRPAPAPLRLTVTPTPAFGEPLTPDEPAFLDSQNDLAGLGPDDEARFHRAVAETTARDLTASRTVDEVARLLGTSAQQIDSAGLISFSGGDGVRYPLWQLVQVGGGFCVTLPHLQQVVAAVPKGLSHISVRGFMTTPQRELVIKGTPVSPTAWLVLGGDSAVVCELLASIDVGW